MLANKTINFPCVKCSVCCRMLDKVNFKLNLENFNGTCAYLSNNLCSIYNKRPLICNSDKTFYISGLNETNFILINLNYCLQLIKIYQNNILHYTPLPFLNDKVIEIKNLIYKYRLNYINEHNRR
jgi:Fe-S-cluster containining protein